MIQPAGLLRNTREVWPCTVDYSALFDGVDDYMQLPGNADDTQANTYTVSFGIKFAKTTDSILLQGNSSSSARTLIGCYDQKLRLYQHSSYGVEINLYTDALLDDQTGHYLVVVVVDTTNAVEEDRIRVYINNARVALSGRYPGRNRETFINNTHVQYLGGANSVYFGGYLSEFVLVSGLALDPSEFAVPSTGVGGLAVPKGYTGPYGAQGYHLKFNDVAMMGADSSGNDNHFTASIPPAQTTDTPTNNHATYNPLHPATYACGFEVGNTRLYTAGSNKQSAPSTFVATAGKYYCEIMNPDPDDLAAGIMSIGGITDVVYNTVGTVDPSFYGVAGPGNIVFEGAYNGDTFGHAFDLGDVLSLYIDLDASTLELRLNDVPAPNVLSISPGYYGVIVCDTTSAAYTAVDLRVRPETWTYTPPEGYLPLCADAITANGYILSGSYIGNANVNGPFVTTNCALESVTIDGTTYQNDGTATAVIRFCSTGFKLVSAGAAENTATTHAWTGVLKYPAKYANAQTN